MCKMLFWVSYSRNIIYTDGRFTELLVSDLTGDVCSHEDRHGDAQLLTNYLWDQLQTLWTRINTL